MSSCSERLPSLKALFARNEFLRVGQPESCRQNFLIGKLMEPGQVFPDDGSDRIILLMVPSQILFGLFSEVFEIRHRRNLKITYRRWALPFRPAPMRPTPLSQIVLPQVGLSTQSPPFRAGAGVGQTIACGNKLLLREYIALFRDRDIFLLDSGFNLFELLRNTSGGQRLCS
jgi:hypothetical protein